MITVKEQLYIMHTCMDSTHVHIAHMQACPRTRGTHEDPGQLVFSARWSKEMWCGGVDPDTFTNLWITGGPKQVVNIHCCSTTACY